MTPWTLAKWYLAWVDEDCLDSLVHRQHAWNQAWAIDYSRAYNLIPSAFA